MPSLGADMDAGTILEWLVKPGDSIKRGDIITVVDTEKATIEVEVFQTGIIDKILIPVGEKVPVGTPLAMIREEERAEAPLEVAKPSAAPPKPEVVPKPIPVRSVPIPTPIARPAPVQPLQPVAPAQARLRISPLAMRMALKLKVDLSSLKGTGPGGAICKADIERAVKAAAAPAVAKPVPAAPAERLTAMRRVIASAMARSKREIPHYYLGTTIDMNPTMAWLQSENLKRSINDRILYSVLLLKAVALALRRVPELNGFFIDGAAKPSDGIHVGVAISLRGGGLIAPAIHDVDKMNLDEIMRHLRDLVNRVRAGVLRSSEIADATITVTSLGEQGVESVFGVIYPPQVALVGFGKILERPWAINGMIGVRQVVMASLSGDHRVSDGRRGGLFLSSIAGLLQEPQKL